MSTPLPSNAERPSPSQFPAAVGRAGKFLWHDRYWGRLMKWSIGAGWAWLVVKLFLWQWALDVEAVVQRVSPGGFSKNGSLPLISRQEMEQHIAPVRDEAHRALDLVLPTAAKLDVIASHQEADEKHNYERDLTAELKERFPGERGKAERKKLLHQYHVDTDPRTEAQYRRTPAEAYETIHKEIEE